ncbi:hypothetical protein CMK14_03925 [Candidatus Poribacteria bacterium]|nr:hypothetical protein [Candidatus Poribacteria bacterium]
MMASGRLSVVRLTWNNRPSRPLFLSLGQYTLGEMDKIQALDSANLKPDSLTCQPRAFSPKANAFSTHTTISFFSGPAAHVTIQVYSGAVNWLNGSLSSRHLVQVNGPFVGRVEIARERY